MIEQKVEFGNLIVNKYSFEHLQWSDCDEINSIRQEILLNPVYAEIKPHAEKYIKDLLRFFILKFIHRDFNLSNLNHEDLIIPFNDKLDKVWILFLSKQEQYRTFIKRISAYFLNGEEIIVTRNFDHNIQHKETKRTTSQIKYKNRYETFPDIVSNTAALKRIPNLDEYDYFQGTFFESGNCKSGIYKYSINNQESLSEGDSPYYCFIGTLRDNDDNEARSGYLYLKDGSKVEFRDGYEVDLPDHPNEGYDDNESQTSSVTL